MEQKHKSPINLFSLKKLNTTSLLVTGAVFLAALVMVGLYYKLSYHGLKSRDAIDIAQIAANMSEGHGFTTRMVRPCNATYFHNLDRYYPELNHSPLFPACVALLFKIRTISEQVVAWTSIGFFLLTLAVIYLLGATLFDRRVGLLATGLSAVSMPMLNTAISGEPWTLCTLIFTLLLIGMSVHHANSGAENLKKSILSALACAFLTAVLYMVCPFMVFILIPTAVYFGVTGPAKRICLAAYLIGSAAFITPWAIRNALTTNIPILGMSGWDIAAGTNFYPGDTFYRTAELHGRGFMSLLAFPMEHLGDVSRKVAVGAAQQTSSLMSTLGWFATAFAVVGMLYRFRENTVNAIRGYIYGAIPLMIVCFAAYGTSEGAIRIFTPIAAVLASAYFMLLLDAKKLHNFFVKLLVGGLIFASAFPTLTAILSDSDNMASSTDLELETLLAKDEFNRWAEQAPVYTDVPWMVAWRTKSVGVWLPVSDADCKLLESMSLPFNLVLLTPECEKYDTNEIWSALHLVRTWRAYIRNPEQGFDEIMKALRDMDITVEKFPRLQEIMTQNVPRVYRRFKAADSIRGFTMYPQDPLQPDRIQIFVRSEAR